MQLTMKLKKRWITSVLREAEQTTVSMPWQRGKRRRPVAVQPAITPTRLKLIRA